jgi:hypothetical protein
MLMAVPGLALADPAPETLSGSGFVADTQYSLSVNGGPFGQNPTGYLDLSGTVAGAYTFHATVTCMNTGAGDGITGFRIDDGPNAGEGFLAEFASPGSRLNTTGRDRSPAAPLTGVISGTSDVDQGYRWIWCWCWCWCWY